MTLQKQIEKIQELIRAGRHPKEIKKARMELIKQNRDPRFTRLVANELLVKGGLESIMH